jgi:5'-3' exonuclease
VPGEPATAPVGLPEEIPDTLAPQVPVLLEVLAAAGIATAGAEGYEADDVIGTLAAGERTDPVLGVSGDRDLMQIVRDEPVPVRLLYVGRGLAKAEHLGPAEVAEKYGVPVARAGEAYAEMAMLRGDPSDGLPGVPGIGAKTAATLVGRFDSWAELRAAVIDRADTRLAAPVRSKLAAAAPYLAVVEPVVRVALDAPVQTDRPDTLPSTFADPDRMAALVERWGLTGSVDRLAAALAR